MDPPTWSFLTNHARVLVCVAGDPNIRLREIGATIGITERASHRIVAELVEAGYMTREREGRRNRYTILADRPLPDPLARGQSVGELLTVLRPSEPASCSSRPSKARGGWPRGGSPSTSSR